MNARWALVPRNGSMAMITKGIKNLSPRDGEVKMNDENGQPEKAEQQRLRNRHCLGPVQKRLFLLQPSIIFVRPLNGILCV